MREKEEIWEVLKASLYKLKELVASACIQETPDSTTLSDLDKTEAWIDALSWVLKLES